MPTIRRTSLVKTISLDNQKLPKCLEGMNVKVVRTVQNTPKHVSVSYDANDNELLYETIVLLSAAAAFLTQLLHIYRTVWWLPQSYQYSAVKLYLINPYLMLYVLSLVAPRWLWAFVKTFVINFVPWAHTLAEGSQVPLSFTLGMVHVYSIYLTLEQDEEETGKWFKMACLLYPSLIIIVSCHEKLGNFLELVPSRNLKSTNEDVKHECSTAAKEIRREVDVFREDFNVRLKNVLYHSYVYAVACALIPCCLAQSSVYFDVTIAIRHFFFVWAGSFTLNAVRAFPPKYCDVLHSSARHLGFWDCIGEADDQHAEEWTSTKIWPRGSIVRYHNEVYSARDDLNAAEPGCIHHKRFYSLFVNSALLYVTLLIIQLVIVLSQLFLLCRSSEWTQMISLAFLQMFNVYALFKLLRDTVVKWRVSLIEEIL